MIEIEFINSSFSVAKQNWNTWLGTQWNTGVITDYDEKMGKGVLFLLELEKGLTIAMSDFTAKDNIAFINKAYTSDNNTTITLNFLVMGDVYIVEDKNKPDSKKHYMLNNVVVHHSKSNFSFMLQKGKRSKVIDILFSHEWFLSQFAPTQRETIKTKIINIENHRSFYIDPISAKSFEFTKEILDKILYDEWDNIFLKSRIAFLIEEFVKSYILPRNDEHENVKNSELLLAMIEIKKRINTSLYEKMPSRKTLAKEFLMSESTLDRRFKQYFGKTINDYYLEEKMELAKRILNRDGYSISQIAYLLGYETISAFIKSFRKHFGVPPGSLRKNNISL